MKKFLALAVMLAVATFAVPRADAAQRWVPDEISFRTLANGTFADSAVSRVVGTQLTYDTTTAFPLNVCELPDANNKRALSSQVAAVDSMPLLAFNYYPTANPSFTADADSFLCEMQVSMDGANWVTTTPTRAFDATRTSGTDKCAVFIENNSLNGFTAMVKQIGTVVWATTTGYAVDGATAPTWLQTWGWKYVRFIVQHCGAQGEYRAWVDHWRTDPN